MWSFCSLLGGYYRGHDMNHSEAPKMQVNSDRIVGEGIGMKGELSPAVIETRTTYVGVSELALRFQAVGLGWAEDGIRARAEWLRLSESCRQCGTQRGSESRSGVVRVRLDHESRVCGSTSLSP